MPRFEYSGPSSAEQVALTQLARNIARAEKYERRNDMFDPKALDDSETCSAETAAQSVIQAFLIGLLVGAMLTATIGIAAWFLLG